eukprot:IDg11698t1
MSPFALTILILISTCSSEQQNLRNRIISLSNQSPFTTAFNKKQHHKDAIRTLLLIFQKTAEENERRVKGWYYGAMAEYPCNIPMHPFLLEGLNHTMSKRGLGDFIRPCAAELSLESNSTIMNSLISYFRALEDVKLNVLKSVKGRMDELQQHWETAHTYYSFLYRDEMHQCTLKHVTALRIKGIWSLTAQLTNAPESIPLADWKRQYISENVYLDHQNNMRSIFMTFAGHNRTTTTSLQSWGGRPASSRFTSRFSIAQNPAIQEALHKQWRSRKQAENLVTSSNIAILLIPSQPAMMPLAIKGVELISFSRVNLNAIRLRIFGAGVSLFLVAAMLILLGIVLEIAVKIKLNESKRRILESKLTCIMTRLRNRYAMQCRIRYRWMQCKLCHSELHIFSEKHVGLCPYLMEYDLPSDALAFCRASGAVDLALSDYDVFRRDCEIRLQSLL